MRTIVEAVPIIRNEPRRPAATLRRGSQARTLFADGGNL